MEVDELNLHVWRGSGGYVARPVVPTGFAALDAYLPGGGWPQGALIEVLIDRYGVGELSLLMPALAALTRPNPVQSKKWVAWIAPPFIPYAPALQRHDVDLDRVLLIHPSADGKDAQWAVEQVLRSGSSVGVLAWLATADDIVLRRLQLAAEEQNCWTVLFRPFAAAPSRSPAALRIRLLQHESVARVEILKCRGAQPAVVDVAELPANWLRYLAAQESSDSIGSRMSHVGPGAT